MTTTPALEAQGLFKVFGKNPQSAVKRLRAGQSRADVADEGTAAVIDASFAVAPGEIFVIMGLSGSGKSTIIRMLNGLYEATAGSVTVRGESVTDTTPAKLRELRRDRVSMVFQHFALLPHRSVADNVAYPLQLRGVERSERLAKAEEILREYNLSKMAMVSAQQLIAQTRAPSSYPSVLSDLLPQGAARLWIKEMGHPVKGKSLHRVQVWFLHRMQGRKRSPPMSPWQGGCPEIIPGLRLWVTSVRRGRASRSASRRSAPTPPGHAQALTAKASTLLPLS